MDDLDRLVSCLSKLPGIGRRSAERMAMRLVREPDKITVPLIDALKRSRESIRCCSLCGNVTSVQNDPCRLCVDTSRDGSVICVVEEPSDIVSLEKSGGYHGRYHALMGKLSPMKGDGLGDIRVKSLVERIDREGITEVILALSTDVEGDSTASYIEEMLRAKPVNVSRLAFGLPAGSGITYSDPVTLARAISGRQKI
jgi:recombination protein RecR